jgi:hypothetical protein
MPHPFPGVNPWLENPPLWRDVHHSLISALRDDLAPRLRPRYFVAVETRTYVARLATVPTTVRYPDVTVVHRGGEAVASSSGQEGQPYLTVELPLENVELGYLEVRLMPSGAVVTVIELLSPTNKLPGEDRDVYVQKRRQLLASDASFVEIDLLRAGPAMPYADASASDYRLFIRRREEPLQARLYPFGVRQPIPTFPLPLLADDSEPTVDLGALINSVYDRAGYDLVIDYGAPPQPPLNAEDAAWAAKLLAER